MTNEEKKILDVLTNATKEANPKSLVHVQAGDIATICRLAAAAQSTTTTPVKVEGK